MDRVFSTLRVLAVFAFIVAAAALEKMLFGHVHGVLFAAGIPGLYTSDYPQEYQQYDSQYKGQKEAIGWKWWDTQTYVSGTTTALQQWFNVRATHDLSNMEVAFQLAAPKAFLVRAVRFFVKQEPRSVARAASTNPQTGAMDNIALLINTGVFTFTIGSKSYIQEPLWCLTAGGGAAGIIALEGATADPGGAVDYAQNGVADPRAVNTLAKPIFIAPQINFTAIIDWPAALTLAGANTALSICLDGDLIRPVQ
jgi:hypothetical protein